MDMFHKLYTLKGKEVIKVTTTEQLIAGDKIDRAVGRTTLGDFTICTSFIMVDHRYHGKGDPIVFETMIFSIYPTPHEYSGYKFTSYSDDHVFEYYQTRCCTYNQAVVMHGDAIIEVKNYYLVNSSMAIIKAGALAVATILLIYSIL
jgi:hypothetical protein